jgi:RsiW-degrading membrane proteinase PrsW (M82 family)
MNIAAATALCFIPLLTVFLCTALLSSDFRTGEGLLACILGLIAVVPIAALQFLLDSRNIFSASSPASILVSALILNGLTEETIKMALLSAMPAKQMKPAAFCRYSILSGLTLACFETLIYLISGYENIRLRMFTAVLIHVACAVLDGLFAFSLKHKKADVSPFIYAVLLHGLYNYFAGFGEHSPYFPISFAVIAFAVIECRIKFKKIAAGSSSGEEAAAPPSV